jgi:hypothetical protein
MVSAGIGFHDARIDSKPFALDQTGSHAGSDDAFEYPAKDIALPKPMQPVLRKCRVVWNLVIKVEPAEPTVSQVQFNFLGKLPLRAKAVAVPNDQHPDHQLGIYRGSTDLTVIGGQLLMHAGQNRRQKAVYPPEQVSLRDTIIEPKLIE